MQRMVSMGIGLAATLASVAANAQAAQQCAPRTTVLGSLEQRYSERPVAAGLDNNGAIVEVLAAEDGATWTILVSMPNGVSCVVSAGEHWAPRELTKVPAKGAPL